MTVQPDLCQTRSETTLLDFPRGGSIIKVSNIVEEGKTLKTIDKGRNCCKNYPSKTDTDQQQICFCKYMYNLKDDFILKKLK